MFNTEMKILDWVNVFQSFCGTHTHVNAHKDTLSSACTRALWSSLTSYEGAMIQWVKNKNMKRHSDSLLPHLCRKRERNREANKQTYSGPVVCGCVCVLRQIKMVQLSRHASSSEGSSPFSLSRSLCLWMARQIRQTTPPLIGRHDCYSSV